MATGWSRVACAGGGPGRHSGWQIYLATPQELASSRQHIKAAPSDYPLGRQSRPEEFAAPNGLGPRRYLAPARLFRASPPLSCRGVRLTRRLGHRRRRRGGHRLGCRWRPVGFVLKLRLARAEATRLRLCATLRPITPAPASVTVPGRAETPGLGRTRVGI